MLDVRTHRDGDVLHVTCVGELDESEAAALPGAVVPVLADDAGVRAVVVAVAGITFTDSTGVGAIMITRNAAHARDVGFALDGVPLSLRKLLSITGLASTLGVEAVEIA